MRLQRFLKADLALLRRMRLPRRRRAGRLRGRRPMKRRLLKADLALLRCMRLPRRRRAGLLRARRRMRLRRLSLNLLLHVLPARRPVRRLLLILRRGRLVRLRRRKLLEAGNSPARGSSGFATPRYVSFGMA